jgi:hypothetical protein
MIVGVQRVPRGRLVRMDGRDYDVAGLDVWLCDERGVEMGVPSARWWV